MVPSIFVLSCMLTPGSTLGCQGGPDKGYSVRLSHALFLLCAESMHSEVKGSLLSTGSGAVIIMTAEVLCSQGEVYHIAV